MKRRGKAPCWDSTPGGQQILTGCANKNSEFIRTECVAKVTQILANSQLSQAVCLYRSIYSEKSSVLL
jgi:hypothetical protein